MATQATVDVRSFIVGALVGAVVLFAVGAWFWDRQEAPLRWSTAETERDRAEEVTPNSNVFDYAAQFEQQLKVEDALQKKAQTMLDGIIGKNRSFVRVNVSMDFSRRTMEASSVEPGTTQTVLSEETSEKNSAETGTEESVARSYGVNRLIEDTTGSIGTITRLTMALSVDMTKVIHDIETNEFREVDRQQEEIDQLEQLVKQSVGFDETRGDESTIFALRFDKSQEIQAKETAVTKERRGFWVNVAKIAAILIALLVLRRMWRSSDSNDIRRYLADKDSQAALLIAAGVFLCAHALHLWGDSLSWGELGALPGLFFLLLGVSRVCRCCSSPEAPQSA